MTTTTITTTDRAPRAGTRVGGAPGFLAVLGSEWRKQWTLRSTYVILALAVVLSIGLAALLSTVVAANWSAISPAERATLDSTTISLSGMVLSDIMLVVLAVTAVSSEYATGMIRLTLTTTPRRARVLTAKFLVVGLTALVVGSVVTFGGFGIGQAIFSSYGLDSVGFGDQNVLRTVLLVALSSPATPLLAAGLAVLIRSSAGTIATVLGLMFAPGTLGAMLPDWWQEHVLRYFPSMLAQSLASVEPVPGSLTYLEPGPALAALATWIVVAMVVAYAVFTRRDA